MKIAKALVRSRSQARTDRLNSLSPTRSYRMYLTRLLITEEKVDRVNVQARLGPSFSGPARFYPNKSMLLLILTKRNASFHVLHTDLILSS